jgi:transcription factor SPN1
MEGADQELTDPQPLSGEERPADLDNGNGTEEDGVVSRKRVADGEDGEEEVEEEEEDQPSQTHSKKKKKHRSEEREEEVDEVEPTRETEQEIRRREMLRKIDAAAKGPKKRPRKKADETDLEQAADDEVVRMRDMMQAAANEDHEANLEKRPATAKLRLLKEAVETLQK